MSANIMELQRIKMCLDHPYLHTTIVCWNIFSNTYGWLSKTHHTFEKHVSLQPHVGFTIQSANSAEFTKCLQRRIFWDYFSLLSPNMFCVPFQRLSAIISVQLIAVVNVWKWRNPLNPFESNNVRWTIKVPVRSRFRSRPVPVPFRSGPGSTPLTSGVSAKFRWVILSFRNQSQL